MEEAETITRMRTGDKEHIQRVHVLHCMRGEMGEARNGKGMEAEGCILTCTTVYFVAA